MLLLLFISLFTFRAQHMVIKGNDWDCGRSRQVLAVDCCYEKSSKNGLLVGAGETLQCTRFIKSQPQNLSWELPKLFRFERLMLAIVGVVSIKVEWQCSCCIILYVGEVDEYRTFCCEAESALCDRRASGLTPIGRSRTSEWHQEIYFIHIE